MAGVGPLPTLGRERQITVLLGAGYGYDEIATHHDLGRMRGRKEMMAPAFAKCQPQVQPSFQAIFSPARSGTRVSLPNGSSAGTSQFSLTSVTLPLLRGRR